MHDDDHEDSDKLVPTKPTTQSAAFLPASFFDRLAQDPNAGALVALGVLGLDTFKETQEAERQQHQREMAAEREERRLAAEERKASAERAEREKAAQRAHELELWRRKGRYLAMLGPFWCLAIVFVGLFIILWTKETALGASLITAGGVALVATSKDLTRGLGESPSGEDSKKSLPPAPPKSGDE